MRLESASFGAKRPVTAVTIVRNPVCGNARKHVHGPETNAELRARKSRIHVVPEEAELKATGMTRIHATVEQWL
jgi:hypothetical protein